MTEAQSAIGAVDLDAPRQQRALQIIVPAASAAAYPWFLDADLFAVRAGGFSGALTIAIACIIALAGAVLIVALNISVFRASRDPSTRVICCLAAATPTFFVATMNY